MASRPTCKFWLQGQCKFGDKCRFEHPKNTGNRQENNRYAPLNSNDSRNYNNNNNNNNARGPSTDSRDRSRQPPLRERHIDPDQLRHDLSSEQPIWRLSCYSPRADLPKQLFGGPDREFSPEEVRVRFYELAAQNKMQEAIQEAENIYQQATSQMAKVLEDIPGAIKYLVNGFHNHPNRLDICDECTKTGVYVAPGSSTENNPASANTGSPFGQPAASNSSIAMDQAAKVNPFSQPSVPSVNPVFGQPAAPTQSSLFGRPSTLGVQPAFGQNGFSQGPVQAVFGNPSVPSAAQPAFGQAPRLGTQPSPFATASNPFSQNAQPVGTNPFAAQSTSEVGMQMSPATPKPFGAPFGINAAAPAQPQANGGFLSPKASGFGISSPVTSTFGQTSNGTSGMFNATQTSTAPGQFSQASGGVSAQKDAQGRLQRWNGRQVQYINDQPCYKEDDGYWQRIWFPDGSPPSGKPEELPSDLPYNGDVEERFQTASNSGQFQPGLIPLVMPKREWTNWDF